MINLDVLISEARVKLHYAATSPEEEAHRKEIDEMNAFLRGRIGIMAEVELNLRVTWMGSGATAVMRGGSRVFHLRKAGDGKSCLLYVVDDLGQEREIARIADADPHFVSRLLVAIGDAA